MEQEVWKDVVGYEGYYLVSNLGNIKSLDRKIVQKNQNGEYTRIMRGKRIKNRQNVNGYVYVTLSKGGKARHYMVHRIVALAFINNHQNLPCVNHKDEVRNNNDVSNLEWCSHSYNLRYGSRTEKFVDALGKRIMAIDSDGNVQNFKSIGEAVATIGVKRSGVARCLNGRNKFHHGYKFKEISRSSR